MNVFIDESQIGKWFVVAAVVLENSRLTESQKRFFRGLHAKDDWSVANLTTLGNILRERDALVLYSKTNLEDKPRDSAESIWLTAIGEILGPLLPYFDGGWKIIVEQRSEFSDDSKKLEKRKKAELGRQNIKGDALAAMDKLRCLKRVVSPAVHFYNQDSSPWLGAADYVAYTICSQLSETKRKRGFDQLLADLQVIQIGA